MKIKVKWSMTTPSGEEIYDIESLPDNWSSLNKEEKEEVLWQAIQPVQEELITLVDSFIMFVDSFEEIED